MPQAPGPTCQVKVFITYRNQDDLLCNNIRQAIEKEMAGGEIKVDWQILEGNLRHLHQKLRGQLYESDLVVAILTEPALESREIREELVVAREWHIPILPIFSTGSKGKLPWFLNSEDVHYVEDEIDGLFARQDSNELAKKIVSRVKSYFAACDDETLETERHIRHAIRAVNEQFARLTYDRSVFSDIRLGNMKEVLSAASEEVSRLANKKEPYIQNLSVANNFLIRALPSFSKADRIDAVSIDAVSTFWRRKDQFPNALRYMREQTKATRRIFVVPHAKAAHDLRNVLAAHHRSYGSAHAGGGDRGGVFLCTEQQYHNSLIQGVLEGEPTVVKEEKLQEFKKIDFGILKFIGRGEPEYRFLTLSDDIFTIREIGNTVQGYQKRVLDEFDALVKIRPGQQDAVHQILRWHDSFADDNQAWEGALRKLFYSKERGRKSQYGSVYHLVFFSKKVNRDRLLEVITQNAKSLEDTTTNGGQLDAPKADDLWFGEQSKTLEDLEVVDPEYGGKIRIDRWFVEQYPYCLLKKLKNVDDLKVHYQKASHSDARRAIFSVLDEQIIKSYERAKEAGTSAGKRFYYEAAEAFASQYIVRVDLQECEDIKMIVQGPSIDHGWKTEWQKLSPVK